MRLREFRREHAADFGYTPEEALFCDVFDTYAARWEDLQQSEIVDQPCKRCAVCDELKPPWMTTLTAVPEDPSEWPPVMRGGSEAWITYVEEQCVGRLLCERCRHPSAIEKQLGLHKFSKANDSHLRAWPSKPPSVDLDTHLGTDPYYAFAVANEAEMALVRMTIPWCAVTALEPLVQYATSP